MEFVNAEIKSKEDLVAKITEGLKLFVRGCPLYYDQSYVYKGESPFRVGDSAISGLFYEYAEVQEELPWQHNLKNTGPVLCWVSDNDRNARIHACMVESYQTSTSSRYRFICQDGCKFLYATPVDPKYCLK